MAPHARKTGSRPTAAFAQAAGYAGTEQCSANSPLRPPTGGRMPSWGGPARA